MESPETTEVLGIARKLNKELEALPLHSHGGVISILNSLMQLRQINEQVAREQKKADAQRAAFEHAQAYQAKRESGIVLV